uniref:Uncharacterized protein n=1 Tax=Strongyloides stercoralis TaxID=6248 RepID=A0A0K0DU95_STRER
MNNKTKDGINQNLLNILKEFLDKNKTIIEIISVINNFHEQIVCIKKSPNIMFTCDKYPEWKDNIISKLEFMLTENFDDLRENNNECLFLIKSFVEIIENKNIPTISTSFLDDITEIGCIMNECYLYYNNLLNNISIEYPLNTFPIIEETSTFRKLYERISSDLKLL